MEVVISQMRWPANVYRAIKLHAKAEGVSVNTFVSEAMSKVVGVEQEGEGQNERASDFQE